MSKLDSLKIIYLVDLQYSNKILPLVLSHPHYFLESHKMSQRSQIGQYDEEQQGGCQYQHLDISITACCLIIILHEVKFHCG